MTNSSQYAMVALELLDEFGIAEPGFGLTMRSAAIASGVTRSTIYRHWEVVADLHDDLARYVVADVDGWQRSVLAADPHLDLGDAIAGAVSTSGIEPGAARRMHLAGWPTDRPGRVFGQQWETAWLEAYAVYIANHLGATGCRVAPALLPKANDATRDQDPQAAPEADACRVLALCIAALVEGSHILGLYRHGAFPADWDPAIAPATGRAISRLVDSYTEPGSVPPSDRWEPVVVPPLPESGLCGAKAEHLGRIIEHIRVHPFGGEGSPNPPRLVDMARLARRADVSERRLYSLWPTVASCNADILEAVVERDKDVVPAEALGILSAGFMAPGKRDYWLLMAGGFQSCFEALLGSNRMNLLRAAHGLTDPEVRTRLRGQLNQPGGLGPSVDLSLLAMIRDSLGPDVSVVEYGGAMVATMLGILRLVALHPELMGETGWLDGHEVPLCGLLCVLVNRSLTTPEPTTAVASQIDGSALLLGLGSDPAVPLAPREADH